MTLWSALTCQRFGHLRPVAAVGEIPDWRKHARQCTGGGGGDRSPETKAVTGYRTPKKEELFSLD
jgi:hypothetical protein